MKSEPTPSKPPKSKPLHAFLVQVGVVLHRFGTPSNRLERVWTTLANHLQVKGTCLYTPTSLIVSIIDEDGEQTFLRRIDSGEVEVDKLIRCDEMLDKVIANEISLSDASRELEQIENSDPPFSTWQSIAAMTVACGAVAVFFRGTPAEVASAAMLGLVIALLDFLPAKFNWEQGLLEPLAGFIAAIGALAIAQFVIPIDDRLVTLAAVIIHVPGLKVTLALNELAVGHLAAGTARLAGACVNLLTITVGVAVGWRIAIGWRNIPDVDPSQNHSFWLWLAIVIAPISFAIMFQARWRQWLPIMAVSIAGFTANLYAGNNWGIEVGAAIGALAVGCGSNLYARIWRRPALVTLTPGILALVPGSVGYRSLTAFLDNDTLAGIDLAFQMLIVAIALVGGILSANVLVPPRRIL